MSSKLKTLTVAEEHGNKLTENEFGIDTVNKSSLFQLNNNVCAH